MARRSSALVSGDPPIMSPRTTTPVISSCGSILDKFSLYSAAPPRHLPCCSSRYLGPPSACPLRYTDLVQMFHDLRARTITSGSRHLQIFRTSVVSQPLRQHKFPTQLYLLCINPLASGAHCSGRKHTCAIGILQIFNILIFFKFFSKYPIDSFLFR